MYVFLRLLWLPATLTLAGLLYAPAGARDGCVPNGGGDPHFASWKVQKSIGDCYLGAGNFKLADYWYIYAEDNFDGRYASLEGVKLRPTPEDILISQLYYRHAIVETKLGNHEYAETDAIVSYQLDPSDPHARFLQVISPKFFGIYSATLADEKNQGNLDASAAPEEREQFEYWDRLSDDERQIVADYGGSRRSNMDARPCHVSSDYSSTVGEILIWQYACLDGNGPGKSSYTFVNGKLTDRASY